MDPLQGPPSGASLCYSSPTPLTGLFLPVEVTCSALSFAQIIDYQESVPTSYVTLGQGLPFSGSSCPQMMTPTWSLTEL